MKNLLILLRIIGHRPLGLVTETYTYKAERSPKHDNVRRTTMPCTGVTFNKWYKTKRRKIHQ